MKLATDDQIERWKRKYGAEFLNDLEMIRSGKLTMQEVADKIGVTKETIRWYFHHYYSDADLISTRYYKDKNQSVKPAGNIDSKSLPENRHSDSDIQIIKAELLELAKDFREHDKEVFVYLDLFKKQLETILENTELRSVSRSNFRFEKDDD
jgi:hypothetical protein